MLKRLRSQKYDMCSKQVSAYFAKSNIHLVADNGNFQKTQQGRLPKVPPPDSSRPGYDDACELSMVMTFMAISNMLVDKTERS